MSDHDHPDFRNVVRVARFHQAPQRVQCLIDQPANVVVLPVIRIERAGDLVDRRRERLAIANAGPDVFKTVPRAHLLPLVALEIDLGGEPPS